MSASAIIRVTSLAVGIGGSAGPTTTSPRGRRRERASSATGRVTATFTESGAYDCSRRSLLFARESSRSERAGRGPVLIQQRRELSRCHRDVHGPANPEDAVGEDDVARRIPVRGTQALDRRQTKVVGDGTRDLSVPGALGLGLAELLIDRGEERQPNRGADEPPEISHRAVAGAGVVPGCVAGMPDAHSGHSEGAYVGMSRRQSASCGIPDPRAPADRSTRTATPITA